MSRNQKSGKRQQPRKDSKDPRVNYDNTRESKFKKDVGRKGSDRRKDNAENVDVKGRTNKGAVNDPGWYAANPELLRAAASLPFSTTVGLPIEAFQSLGGSIPSAWPTVPGVMSLYWDPSVGGGFEDAINQATNSTYSFTVHGNSRTKSYDGPDEMIIILCGASAFSMLALGMRTYGLMKLYSQQNAYLPRALVEASGFDFDDLIANLPNMWFDLNELVARSEQIWIPNKFPFVTRWFWLNSNVYMDGESIKSQYYLFTPSSYLQLDETDDATKATTAKFRTWWKPNKTAFSVVTVGGSSYIEGPTPLKKWSDYISAMNSIFNSLLNSQDRGIIFGDILKAFGADSLYKVGPISSDLIVAPVYDREVLTQIENATINPFGTPWQIGQVNGRLKTMAYTPTATSNIALKQTISQQVISNWNKTILNFHQKEVPTPEQIMVATRLKCAGMAYQENAKTYINPNTHAGFQPATCGTETLSAIAISKMAVSDKSNAWLLNGTATSPTVDMVMGRPYLYPVPQSLRDSSYPASQTSTGKLHTIQDWSAFDWAPWLYESNGSTTATTELTIDNDGTITGTMWDEPMVDLAMGDYEMYTTVDLNELKKMHQTAIYSEFGVPFM